MKLFSVTEESRGGEQRNDDTNTNVEEGLVGKLNLDRQARGYFEPESVEGLKKTPAGVKKPGKTQIGEASNHNNAPRTLITAG